MKASTPGKGCQPFRCPKCGSANVELKSAFGGFAGFLENAMASKRPLAGGKKILVCRDCGRKTVLFIR